MNTGKVFGKRCANCDAIEQSEEALIDLLDMARKMLTKRQFAVIAAASFLQKKRRDGIIEYESWGGVHTNHEARRRAT